MATTALTFMILDGDLVACSPASVYHVLQAAGVLTRNNGQLSSKSKGFVQPLQQQEHWPLGGAYLNIAGTSYYLCSIRDGCSRFLVH
jgi:hypothetical protein